MKLSGPPTPQRPLAHDASRKDERSQRRKMQKEAKARKLSGAQSGDSAKRAAASPLPELPQPLSTEDWADHLFSRASHTPSMKAMMPAPLDPGRFKTQSKHAAAYAPQQGDAQARIPLYSPVRSAPRYSTGPTAGQLPSMTDFSGSDISFRPDSPSLSETARFSVLEPLERTDANYEVYNWLTSVSGGRDPIKLTTDSEEFVAVDTGLHGGFGEIFVAIDAKSKIWGLKQMRSPQEVALLESIAKSSPDKARVVSPVQGTPFHQAEREVNLTQSLAPGLDAQDLMFTSNDRTFIAMKLMVSSGDNAFAQAPPRLRSEVGRHLLGAAAAKLDFVHASGFVHRDVKLENTLIDNEGNLEIADFGFATPDAPVGHWSGTYIAPELLKSYAKHEAPADVFALCASVVDHFSGKEDIGPFGIWGFDAAAVKTMLRNAEDFTTFRLLALGDYAIPKHLEYLSRRFDNLKNEDPDLWEMILEHGMHPDPKSRATMNEVVNMVARLPYNPIDSSQASTYLTTDLKPPPRVKELERALKDAFPVLINRS